MLQEGATLRTVTGRRGVSRSLWHNYGYDSKRPEGTEEDLGKDAGDPQQRVRIVISGTWYVVTISLRLELSRMISSRLQMSVLVIKQSQSVARIRFGAQKTHPISSTHCSTPQSSSGVCTGTPTLAASTLANHSLYR